MTRNRFRLMAVSIPILALTLGLPFRAAAAVVSNTQTPISGMVSDPCTGDTVSFTANLHVVARTTVDENGGTHTAFTVNIDDYTATGAPSGDSYTAHFNQTGQANVTSGGASETSMVFTEGLHSAGSSDNAQVIMVVHVTVNPDGTVTASVSNVTIRCVG